MFRKNIVNWTDRYVRLGNIHIIVDVDATIVKNFEKMNDISSMNFHLFISKMGSVDNIIPFVDALRNSMKLTIHVPKQLKDIGVLLKNILQDHPYCKIIVEKKGPRFKVPGETRTWIVISYKNDGIFMDLRLIHSIYNGYDINTFSPLSCSAPAIISNTPRLIQPLLFKDKLIEEFKKITPVGILTSFKNDEDIWDYIMLENEWTVNKEDY